jgi:hypothetical protein
MGIPKRGFSADINAQVEIVKKKHFKKYYQEVLYRFIILYASTYSSNKSFVKLVVDVKLPAPSFP